MMKFFLVLLVCSNLAYAESKEKKIIASFSSGNLDGWQTIKFKGETSYHLVKGESGHVLKSMSKDSASGLITKYKVDITKFPILNWRWRANTKFQPMNEQKKEGDDYVARLYVVVSGGWFFWQAKALTYVWSSQKDKGAFWPNAYAPNNTRMIALRTTLDETGVWYQEKRNVYQDLKQWLGEDVDEVEAIAIMTDSDDSHSTASALYGDIYFSTE